MLGIFIIVLVVGVLVTLEHFWGPMGTRRKPLPCAHGVVGVCKICWAEMEQSNRREGHKREWERLRRAEIKRLSQARLSSSESYFAMEPRQFEDSVMRVFRKLGYKVNQTAYVADGGKDAIAWKGKKKYVIECKRYGSRSSTGRRDLQILLAARHDVEADGAIFVTTGRLTAPAIAYAKDNDIECYDKDSFPNLINHAYGSDEDYSMAKTICLECGREAWLPLSNESAASGNAQHDGSWHEVNTTICISQLKYPDLDMDTPWCQEHHVPMRRVNGYRGEFWGCPEYPSCKKTGGSAARPPEVVEAERIARRAELMRVYSGMSETLREQWGKKVDLEMAELTKLGLRSDRSPEDIAAHIATKYMQGR
jgi:ssDNA-binding Zn-finger/Zn-ribbon topoisomerase 1